jgi:hypothetical protein
MRRAITLAHRIVLVAPRENLSAMLTGIWFSIATNIMANGAMEHSKHLYLYPGTVALLGCIIWHLWAMRTHELIRAMEEKRGSGFDADFVKSALNEQLQNGNAWLEVILGLIISVLMGAICFGTMVYMEFEA